MQFNSQSLYIFEMESTGDVADPELFLWQELSQSLMLNAVSSWILPVQVRRNCNTTVIDRSVAVSS